MWMMTAEHTNKLLKQRDSKLSELTILKAKTPESIWEDDLEALEKKLNEVEENECQDKSKADGFEVQFKINNDIMQKHNEKAAAKVHAKAKKKASEEHLNDSLLVNKIKELGGFKFLFCFEWWIFE